MFLGTLGASLLGKILAGLFVFDSFCVEHVPEEIK